MPRVSIIIPTFNCAPFLGKAIDSALAQTYTDYEILVVDDGSTDGTASCVDAYGARVQYLYQANRGVSAARNAAVSNSSGEFLAYLDADDRWYAQKLAKQVAFLDAHPECGLVHSDISVINDHDELIHLRANEERHQLPPQGKCDMALVQRNHVAIVSVLERRQCFDRAGGFSTVLPAAQDYHHWIQIALQGIQFGYIGEPLALYRWRAGSVSESSERIYEDLVWIFQELLTEPPPAVAGNQDLQNMLRKRLYHAQRDLAYLERVGGRHAKSVRRILSLIKEWPRSPELYFDLAKTCLPEKVARIIRSGISDSPNPA